MVEANNRQTAGGSAAGDSLRTRLARRLRPRTASLKFKLTLLVILCWLTPMLVVGGYSIVSILGSINGRIRASVRYTADYAGEATVQELQNTITLSRDASYDTDIWKSYKEYQTDRDDVVFNRGVTSYLAGKYYFADDFTYACMFLCNEPNNIFYVSRNGPSNYDYYTEHVHQAAIRLSKTLGNTTNFIVQDNRVFVIRDLLNKDNFKPYAVLVLQIDPQTVFRDFTGNTLWDGNVLFTINGQSGWAGQEDLPTDAYLDKVSSGSTSITENKDSIYFYGKLKPDTDDFILGYKVTIDKAMMFKSYRNLPLILILLMLALLPLLAAVLWFFNRSITRPVAELVKATRALEAGQLGTQVKHVHRDEIGQIAASFNAMSRQIRGLIDRIVKEQTASRNSRIMALESQINPHFLNNTLEMMNWRSRLKGDEELSKMIESLSTILEAGMDRNKKMLIPLREEMQHADAYLYIMSMRFGSRLEIRKEIDTDILDWMVPRLIFQPLLENAIVHGLEPVEHAVLWFTVAREGEYGLRVSIRNSGHEINEAEVARVNRMLEDSSGSGGRLGMANISERLRLIYGSAAGLRLKKQPDGTTQTEIFVQDIRINLISE